ncbi:histidine phosphatase family protein [Jannaschia seohaensis]|uniref:Broad specificity phosphatase PhoE n=1 Tax=Jannaschia seohaensis TaxID=475081 RepID=A0A2Y9AZ69_9RHOB|nr:histidine phosphatase family protein [Jannaschia seohaensis]PWJ16160.1 broad specificity phosphatase PhoE [Jannaschia seohaensis]SSA49155.1 Broad specificity phosphatase PhoE [Jannaschia seohaensis]
MTRLWLIRHGPTHAKRMVGWTDLPADLSDTAALARLEAALPDAPVISSDLIRAVTTADAIQGPRDRLPHMHALREFHYGDWENRAFDEIDEPTLRAYFETPGSLRAPGGESWNDVSERVHAAIASLTGGPDLIVVAHMGVILTLWARARAVAPYEALSQKIDNLSLTRIDWAAHGLVPHFANLRP